jgi:chaperonin GroEL (HSP60 family)
MYGPKGLNKMIIPITNETVVTQKGLRVVKTYKSRVPITLMLINLAETQEKKCGDGTKTVLLLTSFLLEKAKEMLRQGISAQIINKGYFIAMTKALDILEDNTILLSDDFQNELSSVIRSVMNNKLTSTSKKIFIDLILKTIVDNKKLLIDANDFDFSDIFYRKVQGKGIHESEVIKGMVIYKDKPTHSIPSKITNPRILLIKQNLDFFLPQNHEAYQKDVYIDSVEKYRQFSQFNNSYYKNLALFFKEKGVDVILCRRKVNKSFIEFCAELGIITLELVGKEDLNKLSKMLEVSVISSIKDFSSAEIGTANLVEYKKITDDEMLILKKEDSPIFTFLLRGGSPLILDELEEIINTSFRVALDTIRDRKFLPGGGALECELSQKLKEYANSYSNKYQLVITEYAKALENLPAYLIINSAKDPFDLIPQLKAEHSNGNCRMGFNSYSNEIIDVIYNGIFDGYNAKKHAIKIASAMARQILRVDGLVMVYDRKLYEKIEEEGKQHRKANHQERIRQHIKKTDIEF